MKRIIAIGVLVFLGSAIIYLDHSIIVPFLVFDNVPLMGGDNLNLIQQGVVYE